ncbi:ELMO domain-containing protein [Acrasis kona]|uniref:ELMO domain-containing protein n=1 Tax=Acrasis kona TaxID=1008807 RepID=A0AAW2ZND8_9EUKA
MSGKDSSSPETKSSNKRSLHLDVEPFGKQQNNNPDTPKHELVGEKRDSPRIHPFAYVEDHFSSNPSPTKSPTNVRRVYTKNAEYNKTKQSPIRRSLDEQRERAPSPTIISIENGIVNKVKVLDDAENSSPSEFEVDVDSDQEDDGIVLYDLPTQGNSTTLIDFEVNIKTHGWCCTSATSKPYVVYNLEVTVRQSSKTDPVTWTVPRRYNEFRAFHAVFKKRFEAFKKKRGEQDVATSNAIMPQLPTSMIINKSDDNIRLRRLELQQYMNIVVSNSMIAAMAYAHIGNSEGGHHRAMHDCLVTFLDVQGSPVGYLFDDARMDPHHRYNTIREQKKAVKQKLSAESAMLANATPEKDQDWYEERFNNMESLKEELNQIRLLGDEFIVYIKQQLYSFTIARGGDIYMVSPPLRPIWNQHQDSDDNIMVAERLAYLLSPAAQSAHHMHSDQVNSIKLINNSFRGDGTEAMMLNYCGQKISFYCHFRYELLETLGSHVNLTNKNQIKMRKDLVNRILPYRDEKYNDKNSEHEEKLLSLWNLIYPETPLLERKCEQWEKIGFQGQDPATDFRAMGMLGLNILIYLATYHQQRIRAILSLQHEYPFSVSVINIASSILNNTLKISSHKSKSLQIDDDQESIFESKAFLFLSCQINQVECPFEELVWTACELLDVIWINEKASYMEYPKVLQICMDHLNKVLDNRPVSFAHMRNMLRLTSNNN